jgi:hypothetical protein
MRFLKIPLVLFAGAAIALTPRSGWAAQQSGNGAYERARISLTPPYRTAFTEIVANARARGLPIEPLIDKTLEGKAKRRPQSEIIAVVRKRMKYLERAQSLGRYRSPVDLIAVADALNRGLDEKMVRQLRAGARANEPLGLAVHTVADLIDNKVPRTVALDMISGWRSRGASASELRELSASVERLVRQGATPTVAGSAVASALRSGRAAGSVQLATALRANARTPAGNATNLQRQASTAAARSGSTPPPTSAGAKATPKPGIKGQ